VSSAINANTGTNKRSEDVIEESSLWKYDVIYGDIVPHALEFPPTYFFLTVLTNISPRYKTNSL
jgi:hypothetical protein